jgi:hypothetical protein
MDPDGQDPGVGKRSLLNRYNLLVLNKQIVDGNPSAWTDADIHARSLALAKEILVIWARPSTVT